MGHTYRTTGINLKGMALGESDRLLTILTKEHGLIRVIAPGARKYKSGMAGRSGLFIVNDLLISKGKSLDRISQAEILQSFVGLGKNLAKLTAAQYLAELTLLQALTAMPQEDLFLLLTEHLLRLEQLQDTVAVLSHLNHGIYHLLAIAGVAPLVHNCCITREQIEPNFEQPKWRVGFSLNGGGIVKILGEHLPDLKVNFLLNAIELHSLQQLAQAELSDPEMPGSGINVWLTIEKVLRAYAQYHFDKTIQAATLIDNCFTL
jgi:DNA repair protein RecO (recombination protein O)